MFPNHDKEAAFISKLENAITNQNAILLALYEAKSLDGSKEGYSLLMHVISTTDCLIEQIKQDCVASCYGLSA